MADLPRYVETRGNAVLRQPLALQNCTMYSFFLHADADALTEFCDATFNRPCGHAVEYRVLGPLVMAVCADTLRVRSLDPEHAKWGWGPERDYSFWVPLVDTRSRRLRWFLPYVFVDSGAACVGGRETYGFFKQTGTLTLSPSRDDPAELAVDTLLVDQAGPQAHAITTRLYTIRRVGGGPLASLEAAWHSAEGAVETLVKAEGVRLAEVFAKTLWYGPGIFLDLFEGFLRRSVPMVLLKQFRDAAHAQLASQQQVVEASSVLEAWHGGGLLPEYELAIHACDSHPLVADLGLRVDHQAANGDHIVRPELAFWNRIDFRLNPGNVVWSAR